MKFQVSVSAAIEKAEKSEEAWIGREAKGKAWGFSKFYEEIVEELKKFKIDLEKNRNNPEYECKDVSGYMNFLQNELFHAKFTVADEETKRKLDKILEKLRTLFFLLDGIDIVP